MRKALLFAILSYAGIFAIGGLGAEYWTRHAGLAKLSTDVTTPDIYLSKLRQLGASHPSIALIGDSQIVGEVMAENGDREWRLHTLDRVLEAELRERFGQVGTQLVNFGTNGLLPTDLEFMARDALDQGADLLIFNLSLRFLSADFDQPGKKQGLAWLPELCRQGGAVRRCGWAGTISSYIPMYDLTGVLEKQYLAGPLEGAIPRLAQAMHKRWLAKVDDDMAGPMLLLVQARSRFDSVAFDERGRQLQALRRVFEMLQARRARALMFYSVEEPSQFNQIMPAAKADAVRSSLMAWLTTFQSDRIGIVGPDYKIPTQNYLDYMHLDREGYRLLANRLIDPLARLLDDLPIARSAERPGPK